MSAKPQAHKTIDDILSWASEAAREWKTIRMGIDPICHHEYASEIFDKHREEATKAIQALIAEAKIELANELYNEFHAYPTWEDSTMIDGEAVLDHLAQLTMDKND